ncbi:hypothetical protein [Streptomyces sp. NPDC060027]|uniref:hypothetical protein n=1 Tax=Streptomyces sp. NPDC060027 TaxID=3347040 RepID=UPI00368500FA
MPSTSSASPGSTCSSPRRGAARTGPDRGAGLTALLGRRESEWCPGPAVFLTGRTAPNREARAGALDARVATSGALLFRSAEEAYEQAAP